MIAILVRTSYAMGRPVPQWTRGAAMTPDGRLVVCFGDGGEEVAVLAPVDHRNRG